MRENLYDEGVKPWEQQQRIYVLQSPNMQDSRTWVFCINDWAVHCKKKRKKRNLNEINK